MLTRETARTQLELAHTYLAEQGVEMAWEPGRGTEIAIFGHSPFGIPMWVRAYVPPEAEEFVLELHLGDLLRQQASLDGWDGGDTLVPALQELIDQHALAKAAV